MHKPKIQQKTERRISAGLRLALVAVLLAQIALVVLLSMVLRQRMAVAYTVLELLAIAVAVRIYMKPGRTTSYKLGWILLVLAVPVAGLILYFLWNGDRQQKRLDLKKKPSLDENEAVRGRSAASLEKLRRRYPQWGKLADYLCMQDFLLYQHTRVTYLPTGEAYLEDLLDKAEHAERFIFLEYYIMAEGQIWDRLTDIFRRKAAAGVEIKVIFDDFGSIMRMPPEQVDRLRQMGVQVIVFNPVHHYVNRLYFNYRDHRKIACVDGTVSYTGGANIADEYANLICRFGYWKDCGVRLEGEGAWGLTKMFLELWAQLGGSFEEETDYYRPQLHVDGAGFCQPLCDGPDNNPVNTAEDTFLHLITSANESVYITTPYLAIDEAMMRALCLAADSGVDVRLMMPGIPDHKFAYLVAQCYFGELLERGVKIYTFEPGLLHGKSALSDRQTGFVGSVNMDYRSFQLHFECGAVFYDMPETAAALLDDMESIMARSRYLTYEEWRRRPWLHRLIGTVLRPFAMWM